MPELTRTLHLPVLGNWLLSSRTLLTDSPLFLFWSLKFLRSRAWGHPGSTKVLEISPEMASSPTALPTDVDSCWCLTQLNNWQVFCTSSSLSIRIYQENHEHNSHFGTYTGVVQMCDRKSAVPRLNTTVEAANFPLGSDSRLPDVAHKFPQMSRLRMSQK